MLNLFSGLKNIVSSPTEEDALDELTEAKRDRIEFHRLHVRNGPVKGRGPTSGQTRRMLARAEKRSSRRSYEQRKRAFFATQHEMALLRVNLQRVGVLPWGDPATAPRVTAEQIARSITWLIENFPPAGVIEDLSDSPDYLADVLQQAYDRYAAVNGLSAKKIELNPELFAA